MNRDDITKLAKEAGFGNYAYEAAGIFERFAALVAAAEREKCTGTQEFVTLPREVVGQALEAFAVLLTYNTSSTEYAAGRSARDALRAALERPQNHAPGAWNMVPAGWKLVPVEPNCSMVLAGERSLEQHDFLRLDSAYRAMLAAAPQPKVVEQPQANQPAMTPIAQRKLDSLLAKGYTISGYSIYHERKHQHGFVTGAGLVGWWRPEGMESPKQQGEQEPALVVAYDKQGWRQMLDDMREIPDGTPLYTQPQPKLKPLTNEQIDAIADAMPGGLEGFMKGWGWRQFARAVLEATNNIK